MKLEKIFLTVGTTSFDSLIETVDCVEFLQLIWRCGCKNLVLQVGRGIYMPTFLKEHECAKYKMSFECFRFKPSLGAEMESADLVISHGGAGSILEAVTLKKLLIVVVNDTLQENHQVELADAMTSRNYCFQTLPVGLMSIMREVVEKIENISYAENAKQGVGIGKDKRGGVSSADLSRSHHQLELLPSLGLVPYPEADLNAFPNAVNSMFTFGKEE